MPDKTQVYLVTRGNTANNQGGPVLTPQLLLKAFHQERAGTVHLGAIFADHSFSGYQELADFLGAPDASPNPSTLKRILKKIMPGVLYRGFGFLTNILGFSSLLSRTLKGNSPDAVILHAHDLVAAFLCSLGRRKKYRMILTVHDKGGWLREVMFQHPVLRYTPAAWVMRWIENRGIDHAAIITFTSNGSKVLFEVTHPGMLARKDARVVYTGVDSKALDHEPANTAMPAITATPEGNLKILCVGALVADKGIDTLVEALAGLPAEQRARVTCFIVGSGYLQPELETAITRHGIQDTVKMLGFVSREDLIGLMRTADVFVLPSRVAVFDYVLLEAAVLGLPIITTAVGGNLEMFDAQSALLIPAGDSAALQAAIETMLAIEKRKRYAESSQQRIRSNFSLEMMLDSYLNLYH